MQNVAGTQNDKNAKCNTCKILETKNAKNIECLYHQWYTQWYIWDERVLRALNKKLKRLLEKIKINLFITLTISSL